MPEEQEVGDNYNGSLCEERMKMNPIKKLQTQMLALHFEIVDLRYALASGKEYHKTLALLRMKNNRYHALQRELKQLQGGEN